MVLLCLCVGFRLWKVKMVTKVIDDTKSYLFGEEKADSVDMQAWTRNRGRQVVT